MVESDCNLLFTCRQLSASIQWQSQYAVQQQHQRGKRKYKFLKRKKKIEYKTKRVISFDLMIAHQSLIWRFSHKLIVLSSSLAILMAICCNSATISPLTGPPAYGLVKYYLFAKPYGSQLSSLHLILHLMLSQMRIIRSIINSSKLAILR